MVQDLSYNLDEPALTSRLRRIEGQVCGLQRQVHEQAPRLDILMQISAATRTLDSVALLLLDQHIRHCVAPTAAPIERSEKLDDGSRAIGTLVHSQA